jgi:hypothetical protein
MVNMRPHPEEHRDRDASRRMKAIEIEIALALGALAKRIDDGELAEFAPVLHVFSE